MALDIDALVAPVSEDAPAGPDLSYDDERIQIETAFDSSVSDTGDGQAADVDWRGTIALITAQMERTRDLWLPIYLMRAATQSGQFELLGEATELMARLTEDRWEDMHPQLDEYGFIGRKTPCESLTRLRDFLAPLSRMPLLEHPRLGRYSGADFERFHDQGTKAEGYGMFRALLDATPEEDLRAIVDRVDGIRLAIRRADTVMTANAEGDTATNFQPTYEALDKLRRAVASVLPAEAEADGGDGGEDWGGDDWGGASPASGSGAARPSGPAFSGTISSRDDVVRAIDAIQAYYAHFEPTSPVPLVLHRAKEWVSLSFLEVLEDIAPGGLGEAKRILTSGRSTYEESTGGGYEPAAPAAVDDDWSPPASESDSDGW